MMKNFFLLAVLSSLIYGCTLNEIATKDEVEKVEGKLQAHQMNLSEEVLAQKRNLAHLESDLEEIQQSLASGRQEASSQWNTYSSRLVTLEKKLSDLENKMSQTQNDISKIISTLEQKLGIQAKQIDEARKMDLAQTEEKFKVILEEISKENERLWNEIRKLSRSPSSSQTGNSHLIRAGENLSSIALQYGISTRALAEENAIDNPNSIRVGQKLKIPEK